MERFLLGKRKLDETARRPDQAARTGEDGGRVTPCTVLSWNANGLMARIEAKRHMEEFGQLVTRLSPDVVCIQEARIAAYCANLKAKKDSPDPRVRWRPADKEKHELEKALGAPPFTSYQPFYSLANHRFAGTMLLIKKSLGRVLVHCSIDSALAAIRAQAEIDTQAAAETTLPTATAAGAGTSATAPTAAPTASSTSHPNGGPAAIPSRDKPHDPEGRFQFVRFQGLDMLHTYVPNRGWTEGSINKRRQWDEAVLAFLTERAALAPHTALMWCGDLNAAHTPDDSTDETYFRNEREGFDSNSNYDAIPIRDRGIPGFSDNERERFSQLLTSAGLVDAWRSLNPAPAQTGAPPPLRTSASFTWRGTLRKEGNSKAAKYEGKAQRLDYFLLSESLRQRLETCEILGHGTERTGFCGSDHCPIWLMLAPAGAAPASGEAAV